MKMVRSSQQPPQQAPSEAVTQQPPALRAGAHVVSQGRAARAGLPPDIVASRAQASANRNAQRVQQGHRAEPSGGKGRKTSANSPPTGNPKKTSQDVGPSGSHGNQHRPSQNEPSTSNQGNQRRVNQSEAAAAERRRKASHGHPRPNNDANGGNSSGASASNTNGGAASPPSKKTVRSQPGKSSAANPRAGSADAGASRQGSGAAAGRPVNSHGGRSTNQSGRPTSPASRTTSPISASSRSTGSSSTAQSPVSSSSGAQSPVSSTSIPSTSRSASSGNSTPSGARSVGASSSNSSSAQSGSQAASSSSSAPSATSQSVSGSSSSSSHQSGGARARTNTGAPSNTSRSAENRTGQTGAVAGPSGSATMPSTSSGRSQSNTSAAKTSVPSSRPSAPAPQQHLIDVRSQLENSRSNQSRFQPRVQRSTQTTQTPPQMDVRDCGEGAGHRTANLNSVNIEMDSDNHLVTSNLPPGVTGERPEVNEALPDILNSHVLPPYSAGRQNQHRAMRQNQHRSRPRRRPPPGTTNLNEDRNSSCCQCNRYCCMRCVTHVTSFRWVLVSLAMLGVCCVVTGIILGALHMTVGSSFLTLSLMFIGLGVMLVVVVGLGWKCTPAGHEPCHLLFHLGDHAPDDTELPPVVNTNANSSRQRPAARDRNQWFGGVLYSEFRFRRPPPSYNASMQEYQQQLMAAQLHPPPPPAPGLPIPPAENYDNYSLPSSPPPTYKSRASTIRTGLHITFPPTEGGEYPHSRPPTYRSHAEPEPRPSIPMDETSATTPIEVTSGTETSPGSPQETLPDSAGSTLHRVNRVVQYLEGVLEGQSGMSDSEESHGIRSRSSSAATDSEGRTGNQSDGATSDTTVPERVADTHL